VLTDIRALADHFLMALPNINNRHLANEVVVDLAPVDKLPRVSEVHDLHGTLD